MHISSGLASVLNATTPLFTVLVLASFGDERLIVRRIVGVLIGLIGVYVPCAIRAMCSPEAGLSACCSASAQP